MPCSVGSVTGSSRGRRARCHARPRPAFGTSVQLLLWRRNRPCLYEHGRTGVDPRLLAPKQFPNAPAPRGRRPESGVQPEPTGAKGTSTSPRSLNRPTLNSCTEEGNRSHFIASGLRSLNARIATRVANRRRAGAASGRGGHALSRRRSPRPESRSLPQGGAPGKGRVLMRRRKSWLLTGCSSLRARLRQRRPATEMRPGRH